MESIVSEFGIQGIDARSTEAVEFATLEWGDWFNHRELLETSGYVPQAEVEEAYFRQLNESAMAA